MRNTKSCYLKLKKVPCHVSNLSFFQLQTNSNFEIAFQVMPQLVFYNCDKNFYGSTFWPSGFDFKTGSGPNPIKIFLAQFTMRRNSSIRIESKWLDGLMQPIWKLVRKLRLKIVHSLLFWYKMFKWEFFLNLRRLFLFWAKCYFRTIS